MRVIPEAVLASLNIWMEARGEEWEGKCAIGEVMRNRLKAKTFGVSLVEVILSPYQFSGWNTKDPNRILALSLDDEAPIYQECFRAWHASDKTAYTLGATFYFNPRAVREYPAWATPAKFLCQVGKHHFYRG